MAEKEADKSMLQHKDWLPCAIDNHGLEARVTRQHWLGMGIFGGKWHCAYTVKNQRYDHFHDFAPGCQGYFPVFVKAAEVHNIS